MLDLQNIHFTVKKGDEDLHLLEKVNLQVPAGHFMAIVGPSGCGKSTLLKLIAGINVETEGTVFWQGHNLTEESDMEPSECGYVPQFSIAYDQLTVEESIESSIQLRVKTKNRNVRYVLADRVLTQTGLDPIRNRQVSVLSGGQKRRLALAMELVTDPLLLLADEVTSGLDPKSEEEIVRLLYELSRQGERTVINVTHSLANLDLYDSVLVLFEGRIVYHGPPRAISHYFSVEEAEDVYPRLTKRDPSEWAASWEKHRVEYYKTLNDSAENSLTRNLGKVSASEGEKQREHQGHAETPGFMTQFFALLMRRCKIFGRDTGQIILQVAILVGFPLLVILFDLDGVDQTQRLSDGIPVTPDAMRAELAVNEHNLNLGGLVSGLVMFQVVLLTLMGSNNSAREIAGERQIFEKEKLGGVSPAAYLASKVAFLSVLVGVQSFWMAIFVQAVCKIPTTSMAPQIALLLLVNAAMTAICLGISATAKNGDQASLLSIYLVGFQLPLSGAVLALPAVAAWITRPFISAYWSWAGIMRALEGSYEDAVDKVTETPLLATWICVVVLILHVAAGLGVAWWGVKRTRWIE